MEAFVDMVKRLQGQGYTRDAAEAQASLSIMDQDLNSQVPQDTPPVVNQGTVPPAPPVNVSFAPQSAPTPQAVPAPTQAGEATVEAPVSSQGYSFDNSVYPGEATPTDVESIGGTEVKDGVPDPNAFKYEVSPASDGDAFLESILAFGLQTLITAANPNTQNWGQAIASGLGSGSNAFFSAMDRNKRVENIKALEDMGYNKTSINQYLKTGDNKVLSKDPMPKMTWMNAPTDEAGNIRVQLFNSETGEPVIRDGKPVFHTTGSVYDKPAEMKSHDGSTWVWDHASKRWVKQAGGKSTSSVDGVREGAGPNGELVWESGDGVVYSTNAKGQAVPATKAVADQYRANISAQNAPTRRKTPYGNEYVMKTEQGEDYVMDMSDMDPTLLKTGDEKKHARFVEEAVQSEMDFRDAVAKGADPTSYQTAVYKNGMYPQIAVPAKYENLEAAKARFINAILRLDTGAAYTWLEQNDVNKLFPQPGEGPEVVKQKEAMRETLLRGFATGTGAGADIANSHITKKLGQQQERLEKDSAKRNENKKRLEESRKTPSTTPSKSEGVRRTGKDKQGRPVIETAPGSGRFVLQ